MEPNPQEVIARYRRIAPVYDLFTGFATLRLRREAVERLGLQRGDTVVDAGCGTGLSFPFLEEKVGPQGQIIGIEVSPDMAIRARQRVKGHGWGNVSVIEAAAEKAEIQQAADALLLFFAHDISQSEAALQRLLGSLKVGGRIVVAGAKLTDSPLFRLYNPLWLATSRLFVANLEGFGTPWAKLERLIPDRFHAEDRSFGFSYIAYGRK